MEAKTGPRYAADYASWGKVGEALLRAPVAGLDTEFYGVDLRKESCCQRARVHVFSVALPTQQLHPRGYYRARGLTLPAEALGHPNIREWLTSPTHVKLAHNMNVDCHAIENTAPGIVVAGVQDTLALARWRWPERVGPGGGYDLKTLARDLLGRRPLGYFDDIFSRPRRVQRTRTTRVVTCACGAPGCRLRRAGHEKTRTEVIEKYEVELKSREEIPLDTVVPGHELWPTLIEYAAEDAEWALELHSLWTRNPGHRPLPW